MPPQLVPGKPAHPVRSVCRQTAAPHSGRQIPFLKSSSVSNAFKLLRFSQLYSLRSLCFAVLRWNRKMQSLAQVPQHKEKGAIKQQNLQDMGDGDGARNGVKDQKASQGCLESK